MSTINFLTYSMQRPTWLFTLGLETGDRYWLPGIFATPGNPVLFVKRKSSYFAVHSVEAEVADMARGDGIECIYHLGHVFLPYGWIVSVNPEAKPYCVAVINRYQTRENQIA